MQKPLVLVSDHIEAPYQNGRTQLDDFAPRRDYIEIARSLGAELSGYNLSDASWYLWTRKIQKNLKLDLVESLSVATQSSRYNVILSASEKVAIPLAASLYLMRRHVPHIVIGHKLSSLAKRRLFNILPLHRTFSHIICVCRHQHDFAINHLGISEKQVDFIYDKVDQQFFRPLKIEDEGYILAVGQEQRDYKTLLQAISGTGLKLVVVASSPWSSYQNDVEQTEKVTTLRNIPYQKLRDLYARARLVVIPLFDVDYAAGVNSVLEAMAMGKPVITSRTKGITDYIRDNETGRYASPGNFLELRETILSLWEKPAELNRLGENARCAVEEEMNLNTYVDQIVKIIQKNIKP